MQVLKNCWYAAAWSDEVGSTKPLMRTFLGKEVLLFRRENEEAVAIGNRCPHRYAPLHQGTIAGDVVECPYHGLRFDITGRCVHNPQGDGLIPPRASVPSYPLLERFGLLWIWPGDPGLADDSQLPDFPGMDPDENAINRGYMHTAADYQLMSDNILDLSHIEFLHAGFLGSEAVGRAPVSSHVDGETVWSVRVTEDEILPAALDATYETNGAPSTRWLEVRWDAPALIMLTVGAVPMGKERAEGRQTYGVHLMTPETDGSCHYFWSMSRSYRLDDNELHDALQAGIEYAFEHQDKPMVVAQQQLLGDRDLMDSEPVILVGDAAAIKARRILARKIRVEAATSQ